MKIYGDINSGNCQKVKAAADYLGLAYDWIAIDTKTGGTRTDAFLALNAAGQVPTIVLDDGRALAQSNAIVRHLARGSALLPADPYEQAKADEWMFWEQYSHEPYVAVARFQMVYLGKSAAEREPKIIERGESALDTMGRRLQGTRFLAGERISVADVALLPYTRMAGEGGFDLASRPAVRRWIARCEAELGIS